MSDVWLATGLEFDVLLCLVTIFASVSLVAILMWHRQRTTSASEIDRLAREAETLGLAHVMVREIGGRIVRWGEGCTRLYGYSEDDSVGQVSHHLLQTQFPAPLERIETELRTTGHWEGELIHSKQNGEVVVVASHWIFHDNHVIEVNNDITSVRRALEQLRLAEAELRDAERNKNDFLAMLGHELRTPLATMSMGMDILRVRLAKSISEEEKDKWLGIVERQIRHAVCLTDDLLDVGRVATGQLLLRPDDVDLRDVARDAIETASVLIGQRQQQLHCELPAVRMMVWADRVRLVQVVSNLLTNASKFTEVGGSIWLSVSQCHAGRVRLSVRDSGVGIAPEMLTTVFDLYRQVERGNRSSRDGLGIGLALAKRIVERHRGTIEARSGGHDCGTELVIHLPQVVSAQEEALAESAA